MELGGPDYSKVGPKVRCRCLLPWLCKVGCINGLGGQFLLVRVAAS